MRAVIIAIVIGYFLPMYMRYKSWLSKMLKEFPTIKYLQNKTIMNSSCNADECGMTLKLLSDIHTNVGTVASVWFGPGRNQFEISLSDPVDILHVYETCGARAVSIEEREYVSQLGIKDSIFFSNDPELKQLKKNFIDAITTQTLLKKAHYSTYDKFRLYTKNWSNGNVYLVKELEFIIANIVGEFLLGTNVWDDKYYRLLKSIISDSNKISKIERGTIGGALPNQLKSKIKSSFIPEYKEMEQKCRSLKSGLDQVIENAKGEAQVIKASPGSDSVLRHLLGLHLVSEENEQSNQTSKTNENNSSKGMSNNDARANIISSILDLVFPVQATIYWILFNLAGNKDVQEKVLNEIDSKIGRSMSATNEETNRLKYLEACILESMRLSCSVPIIKRQDNKNDVEISGKHIPRGTPINMSVFLALRDKTIFGEDADSFNPNRFIEINETRSEMDIKKMKNYVIAFGFESRHGIGKELSLTIVKCSIAALFQKFEVSFPENFEVKGNAFDELHIDLVAGVAFPDQSHSAKLLFNVRKNLVNI